MTRNWMKALAVLLAMLIIPCGALAEGIEEMLEPPVEEMTLELDGEIPTSETLAVEPEFTDDSLVVESEEVPVEIEEVMAEEGDDTITGEALEADTAARLRSLSPITVSVGQSTTIDIPVSGTQYKSSDKKIATVGLNTGVVKGIKAGTATIGIRVPGYGDYTCKVTVQKAPTKVALNVSKLELGIGDTAQLRSKITPSGCATELTYGSNNTSVAVVDEDGLVTAVGNGKATVGVRTHNGKIAKCTVTVKTLPRDISLDPDEAVLNVKGTLNLNAIVEPAGATTSLAFKSSNSSVASVSSKGKVTAKKAGTATIAVKTANGLTATCHITVAGSGPSKIALSQTSATIAVGEDLELDTALQPANAMTSLSWSSSNSKVAKVSDGIVTGVKAGKATITVKTSNGKKASCKVTVKAAPAKLTVKAAKTTLKVGQTTTVTASQGSVYWSVDGDAVTVDQKGRVKAVEAGEASVWAETSSGQVAGIVLTVYDDEEEENEPRYDDDDDEPSTGSGYIIDISKYQGTVNFDKLAPHVSLVILRVTCGTAVDSKFVTYANALNDRGIPFGVYCYSKASTDAQAKAEALRMYQVAESYGPRFYVMDAEYSTLNQSAISAFAKALRKLGADKIGCYIAHNYYSKFGYAGVRSQYDFTWIPRYGKNDGTLKNSTLPAYSCDLWQYTSSGSIPGISGKVDMNVITGQGKSLSWFTR